MLNFSVDWHGLTAMRLLSCFQPESPSGSVHASPAVLVVLRNGNAVCTSRL
jgi:hypothetical protein